MGFLHNHMVIVQGGLPWHVPVEGLHTTAVACRGALLREPTCWPYQCVLALLYRYSEGGRKGERVGVRERGGCRGEIGKA